MSYCDTYNEESVRLLGEIVAPGCPKRYQSVFGDMLKSVIIPWPDRDKAFTKAELVSMVEEAVQKSFEPYNGSWNGYTAYENEREVLYKTLYGVRRGGSLMNKDFCYEPVSCYCYEDGIFRISLLPDDRAVAYSKRQLDWCRDNSPEDKKSLSDNEITDIMYPAWQRFGDFNSGLPSVKETVAEEKAFIESLYLG